MENNKKAWRYSAFYFAGLALANLLIALFSGVFGTLDVVLLCLGFLPLLIRRRLFLVAYGFLAAFIFLYLAIACLVSQVSPESGPTVFAYLTGYALSVSGLLAAMLLVYAGIGHDRKSFRLV